MIRKALTALAVGLLLTACSQPAEEKIEITLELAQQYLSEGNYQEAIEAFTALIEIDPKNEVLYMGRADAYTYLEQYPEAIGDYSSVISINDDNEEAYIYRGILELVEGDTAAGEEDLQYVAEITADDANDNTYNLIVDYLDRLDIELEKEDSIDGATRQIFVFPDGSHLILINMDGQPFGIIVLEPGEEVPENISENLLTAFVWKNTETEFADIIDMLEFSNTGAVHGKFFDAEQDRAYMIAEGNTCYIASADAGLEPGSSWDPAGFYYTYPEPNRVVPMNNSEFGCNFYVHEGKTYLYVGATSFGAGFLFEPYTSEEQ